MTLKALAEKLVRIYSTKPHDLPLNKLGVLPSVHGEQVF
jgi:hypothetical protein